MLTLVQNCQVIGWLLVVIYLCNLIGPDILVNSLEMYCYHKQYFPNGINPH